MRDPPRHAARFATLVASLALGVFLPGKAEAQISPGPLSRAHASLDLQLGCAQCHGNRREPVTQRCLSCHREIAWQQQQRRGYHARDGRGECASCHPEHAGRDFDLIQWPSGSPERFDHGDAGWTLDGKHGDVKCADCHKAAFRVSAAARVAPRPAALRWVGLEQRCVSCHEDPHRDALGANCAKCHDMAGWKPAPKFDHADTRYPLTGKHADVACADCHAVARLRPRRDPEGQPIPVFRPVPFGDCSSCHTDPHGGRLKGRCASCHVTSSFHTLAKDSFDHGRTRYPLTGKHADVACVKCHAGYPRTVNRPAFATCGTCHRDPHEGRALLAGRAVDCSSCHTVRGFAPSTFTVEQHQATAYPLRGRHATASCASCHLSRGAGALKVVDLRPAFRECTDCHANPHGVLSSGATCEACHNVSTFRPSTIDVAAHARLGYALEGAHRTVPCIACHRELGRPATRRGAATLTRTTPRDTTVLNFPAPRACAACHETPHGNQFASRRDGGACDACHTTDVFRPAARFDHDRDSAFPLRPAHVRVPCASCHVAAPDPRAPSGRGPVVYHGTVARCEHCHSGAKGRP